MFLSVIEYLIPKPLPFMRLGLANLPILLSLIIFPVKGTLLLTLLKVLAQGLINGTLFSYIFIFSAAGSFSSSLMMLTAFHLLGKRVSLIGVSVSGAMASNSIQIILARRFIFGEAAILIAPPFLAVGIVSASILGLFTGNFIEHSEWVKIRKSGTHPPAAAHQASGPPAGNSRVSSSGDRYSRFVFICGIITIPAFIFQPETVFSAATALFFIIYAAAAGKRFRLLPNLLMVTGIIAANLLTPYGRVLAEIGSFRVTAGALEAGASKAALIIGLIYISRSSIRKGLSFPGRLGSLISLVFYYFEKITEGEKLERKNLIAKLDEKLFSLTEEPAESGPAVEEKSRTAVHFTAAAIPAVLVWGLLLYSLLAV
jgi:heptaprenyl diphosphate synthase